MPRAPRSLALWVCCWMAAPLVTTLAAPGIARAADPAPHPSTPAERQARGQEAAKNFVLGRYEEALATYLDLYIQSDGRPEYLRNIGRCQQKLKQYPRAIESFKDYLKRARHLSADERKEVQGFIADIEAQMKEDANAANGATPAPAMAAATKPAPPATPPPATTAAPPAPAPAPAPPAQAYQAYPAPAPASPWPAPQPPPATPGPGYGQPPPNGQAPVPNPAVAYNGGPQPSLAAPAPAPGPPDLVTRPPEATGGEAHASPLRIVGIISVVAAGAAAAGGTLALLNARSTYDDAIKNGCPGGNSKTYCGSKADAVGSANTLSKIFFIGAGVLGVAGITMIVAAPGATPDGRVSLAVSGRF